MIKPTQKLKAFFWKRVILPADQPDNVLWKRIKDQPIDQAEIESLYCDARATAPASVDTVGTVKVTGPSKK